MVAATFFPYAKQCINQDDIDAVTHAVASDTVTRGPQVEAFEAAVADYCGASEAVMFNSGTSALMAAAFAAKLSAADHLLTSPNTFIASAAPALFQCARVSLVDIEATTGNMDTDTIPEKQKWPMTRGRNFVVPVHFAGVPVDMVALSHQILDPQAVVIEDAAHALGSRYPDGQKVGCCAYSDMTVFSFHPAKVITSGEGGMVLTNETHYAKRLRAFRNNGIERDPKFLRGESAPWNYEVMTVTGNFNVTDFQAALGLSQLSRLDTFVTKRQQLLRCYHKELAKVSGLRMLNDKVSKDVAYHLAVVRIDFKTLGIERAELMELLKKEGVGTQVHYVPVYKHPCFVDVYGDQAEAFPATESYYDEALSLPLYPDLEERDIKTICKVIKKALTRKRG